MDDEFLSLAAGFKSTEARDVLLILEGRQEQRLRRYGNLCLWASAAVLVCLLVVFVPELAGPAPWISASFVAALVLLGATLVVLMWGRSVQPASAVSDHLANMKHVREWEIYILRSTPLIATFLVGCALGMGVLINVWLRLEPSDHLLRAALLGGACVEVLSVAVGAYGVWKKPLALRRELDEIDELLRSMREPDV
jgi:hypothetical protein